MPDQEFSNCDMCNSQNVPVSRKYYHYDIKCNCCNHKEDSHFEIVRHCNKCEPNPPKRISVVVDTIEEILNRLLIKK